MNHLSLLLILSIICTPISAAIIGDKVIKLIRISFLTDDSEGTTGNGDFLYTSDLDLCNNYTIDPLPHDKSYFESQLKALDNYYRSVSYDKFGIDLDNSIVYPLNDEDSYTLTNTMDYYNPYAQDDIQEERLTFLFKEAVETAHNEDGIEFDENDLVVVIHAGIGQDFALPFLDPTPEDIPSTYVDIKMLSEYNGGAINIGNSVISHGIILPETQNHLLYDIAESMFEGSETPCEYQFGLTGTFALMIGFAIGLPPLWDTESGESGIGIFGLMDQGSNNGRGLIPSSPDAWTRIYAGWEKPAVVKPGSIIQLPKRSENNLIQVDINDNEYFLIENRTNWFRSGVSIDSSRYLMYEQSSNERYPPFVEVLFDSVEIDKDANGVITSIQNYDLGLPASGLLIWHIDENRINTGLANYSVNGEREKRGVDLEEADGAQDIGYPNIFLFADPTGGYFGDMWFRGNPEYEILYPDFEGEPVEFGPFTYPNTKSNNGASTYLTINNISLPGDTMSFSVSNAMLGDGFPDTTLHIGLVYDFDNDGIPEIVGGNDSLWVAQENSVIDKILFYKPVGLVYDYSVESFELSNDRLVINELIFDSTKITFFEWDLDAGQFLFSEDTVIHEQKVLFVNEPNDFSQRFTVFPFLEIFEIIAFYEDIEGKTGRATYLSNAPLSVADLDFDGYVEWIFIDTTGNLHSRFDKKYESSSGFPIESFPFGQTVLIKNLYGDNHPEIIIQNETDEIIILNWQGNIEYRLTNYGNLICLSEYGGRNAIVTESAIWLFDEVSENYGNEWTSTHHDFGNTRTLHLNISKRIPGKSLIDKDRTYAYPNPAYDGSVKLRIAVESAEKVEIMIYDFAGNFVKQFEMANIRQGLINERTWNINGIESGVYFANVKATKGNKSDSKILKIGIIK